MTHLTRVQGKGYWHWSVLFTKFQNDLKTLDKARELNSVVQFKYIIYNIK